MTPGEEYNEALRRIEETKQTGVTELDLSGLSLTAIPDELKTCENVQYLNLNSNQIRRIENLPARLKSLTLSDDRNTWRSKDGTRHPPMLSEKQVSRIEELPKGLQILKLSRTSINKIEGLPNSLTFLDITESEITRIESLPCGLQSLNLSSNQIGRIEGLLSISSLQSLNLSGNRILQIEGLPQSLQSINLQSNQISQIEGLPSGLQSLHLGSNKISEIEQIPPSLKSLNLWENQIRQIKNLPIGLKSLNLWHNQISRIEELPDSLQFLDLQLNLIRQIENLPINLKELNLQHNQIFCAEKLPTGLTNLFLFDNPIQNVPPELLGKQTWDDCLEAVTAWLADLKLGVIKNRTVRLMVTGNGNVGKSSLIEALEKGLCLTDHQSSHGIFVQTLALPDAPEPLTMQVFDFGGQEIYSGTHQLFLRGRAVQLLVFDAATEAMEVVPDRFTEELVRNQTLRTWLHTIRRSSLGSSFVLVQNKIDVLPTLNAREKAFVEQCEADGLAVTKVSATTGRYVEVLKGHLREAAHALPDYGMEMPLSWHTVRQYFLDNVSTKTQQRTRLITRDELAHRCDSAGVLPLSIPSLLRYLHNSGAVYHDETYLGDTIIADQEWAIEAIYKVLDRQSDLYYELRNLNFGFVLAKTLFRQFGKEYTAQQQRLFLSLMESCGLCFPLKEQVSMTVDDYTYYVFPEFLPTAIPEGVAYFLEDVERPQRVFEQRLDFLPYAHVQQLIARWGTKAKIRDVWRTGFRATAPTGRFTLSADLRKQMLTIHTERSISDEWLAQLLYETAYEYAEWQEIIPTLLCQPVPLSTDSSPNNLRDTLEDVVQPRIKRLVISYAEQDMKFVELLVSKLSTRKSLIDLWYDYNITGRDDWDDEIMDRFGDADGYVIFVSDQYMNANQKRYIHEKEIPLMRQQCGLEAGQTTTGLFRTLIMTTPFNTQYTPLEPFPAFKKGERMPNPTTHPEEASQFIEDFLAEMLFPKFLKL